MLMVGRIIYSMLPIDKPLPQAPQRPNHNRPQSKHAVEDHLFSRWAWGLLHLFDWLGFRVVGIMANNKMHERDYQPNQMVGESSDK